MRRFIVAFISFLSSFLPLHSPGCCWQSYGSQGTCAYIDLNPVAAAPETSRHTSVRQRVQHARSHDQLASLKAAARGSLAGSRAAGRLEESHWLCPLEDLRGKGSPREGMLENFSLGTRWRRLSLPAQPPREGMLENFSSGSYLLLIDYTSRLCRRARRGCRAR